MAKPLFRELSRFVDYGAVDSFLGELGLQRKSGIPSALSLLGLFTLGVVAGATVGLLLAPKSGGELRHDVSQRVAAAREDMANRVQSVTKKGERYNPPS